jgi:hypothetical protein
MLALIRALSHNIAHALESAARPAARSARAPPFRLFSSADASAAFGVGVGVFLDFSWFVFAACLLCALAASPALAEAARTAAPRSFLALGTFAETNTTAMSSMHAASDLCVCAAIVACAAASSLASSMAARRADMAAQTAADYTIQLFIPHEQRSALRDHAAVERAVKRVCDVVLAGRGAAQACVAIAIHADARTKAPRSVFITTRTESQRAFLLSFFARGAICRRRMALELDDAPALLWRAAPAPEPSDIIWKNAALSATNRHGRSIASFLLCTICVALAYACIYWINPQTRAPTVAGLVAGATIAMINAALPDVATAIASAVERPATHSEKQALQLYKLATIKIANSAAMLFLLTKTTDFLSSNTQEQVNAIIIVDAIVSVVSRIVRPTFVFASVLRACRRCCCRRSPTPPPPPAPLRWSMPDRYADCVKFFVAAATFSTSAPSAFLSAAVAIAACRILDSFEAAHRWGAPPRTDHSLALVVPPFFSFAGFMHAYVGLWIAQRWPFGHQHVDASKFSIFARPSWDPNQSQRLAYLAFMILSAALILAQIAFRTAGAIRTHFCTGSGPPRRPVSTIPFSPFEHTLYAPSPGISLVSINAA